MIKAMIVLLRWYLFTAPVLALGTFGFGCLGMLLSQTQPSGRWQHRSLKCWARFVLRVGGIHVTADGIENISPDGVYVYAVNHASFADTPIAVAFLPAPFRFLATAELCRVPFLGTHMRLVGDLPVVRENPRSALKSLTQAAQMIRERRLSVLVFPEGERSAHGLEEFKEGAAYLAIKAGVPVAPVALIGTGAIVPKGELRIRGGHVRLRVGQPLETAGLTVRDSVKLTGVLRERVAELLAGN